MFDEYRALNCYFWEFQSCQSNVVACMVHLHLIHCIKMKHTCVTSVCMHTYVCLMPMSAVFSKLNNIVVRSVSYGFVSGCCVGCFPNKLSVQFNERTYKSVPMPLLSGLICSVGILCSPLLMVNYFCNGVYFDKLFDRYRICVRRYHQYDDKSNMYAFPSFISVCVKPKSFTALDIEFIDEL